MKQYRFVGNAPCDIGGMSYERFGSRAQFTLELAKDVLGGGGNFIPERDFQAIGVTEAEAMTYAYAGGFPEPSPAFLEKRERAQARVRELMADQSALLAYHADVQQEGAE